MKKILSITVLLLIYSCSHAQESNSIRQFDWLIGSWERIDTKPEQTAYEYWSQDGENKLTGIGLTLQQGDTVFIEKLSLISKDGKTYYVAEVSHNSEPTYFEITSVGADGFVCENPSHDFPKKIEYLLNDNYLNVTISGNGKFIPFEFRKISQ